MMYWVIWFIGIIIAFFTHVIINKCEKNSRWNKKDAFTYDDHKVFVNILVISSISTVGGILVAKFFGIFAIKISEDDVSNVSEDIFSDILATLIFFIIVVLVVIAIYVCIYYFLNLEFFEEYKKLRMLFVMVYILSIVGWSIPICHYNSNIEKISQTIIKSEDKRTLLYFYNIPVQKISGKISGGSILGTGTVSGNIKTSDNIQYWYFNQNGEGVFNSVLASDSKIDFIDNDQSAYVEIIVYAEQCVYKNHNNGTENVFTHKTWTEYTFYLPEAIMQYTLN
jgi:hypothetical protein